jgi:hypothetical protein
VRTQPDAGGDLHRMLKAGFDYAEEFAYAE